MSGETEAEVSGWTVDTLHSHLARLRQADLDLFASQRADDHKALQLQHGEYERRLEVLNHAHEQAIEVQHTYVTADKYDAALEQAKAEMDRERERQDARISSLESFQSKAVGAAAPLMLVAGIVGAAVAKAFGLG